MGQVACTPLINLAKNFGYPLVTVSRGGSNPDCCTDPGVICDSVLVNGAPTKILGLKWTNVNQKLKGDINSPNWVGLVDLTAIDLSNQNLTGTLPSFITSHTKLTSIKLEGNRISGIISKFPPSLVTGNFSNNFFSGQIPSIPVSLNSLNIENNRLIGSVPTFPNNLKQLIASNNNLTGNINDFNNVTIFDVSFNSLSGAIPAVPNGILLLNMQNNEFTSVGVMNATLTNFTCDISNNKIYQWQAATWTGKCLMNNILKTTMSTAYSSGVSTSTDTLELSSVTPQLGFTQMETTAISIDVTYLQSDSEFSTMTVTTSRIDTNFCSTYCSTKFIAVVMQTGNRMFYATSYGLVSASFRLLMDIIILGKVLWKTPFLREMRNSRTRKSITLFTPSSKELQSVNGKITM